MKTFFRQLLTDKDGNFSVRELAILLFTLALIVSWIGQQFFKLTVPEFIFYSFCTLVAAGSFGYSIEKKTKL